MKRRDGSTASAPFLGALALCAALFAAPAFAGPNLLANPGFEAAGGSYTGWFTFGSGPQISTPLTDNIARSGSAASKIFGGFVGCPGTPQFNVGGYGQAFTPVVGRVYEFSGFSFIASTDALTGTNVCASNRLLAKIAFFNAAVGGTEIQSNEVVIASGLTPQNQWVPFSFASQAPPGALRVEALILFLQPGCDPGSAFVDDVSLTESAAVTSANSLTNPSFNPGLTGWTGFGNALAEGRTAFAHTRGGSAKMFSTFVPDSPSGLFQSVPAAGGQQWEMSAWALTTCLESPINDTNDNFVTAKLVFRDALAAEIGSNETVLLNAASPAGTWKQSAVSATAPVGTATVEAFILFISPSLNGGAAWIDDVVLRRTDVAGAPGTPPAAVLDVRPAAPNPFRQRTTLAYSLPQRGHVHATILDVAGREIATLFEGEAEAGAHELVWDGRTAGGREAAAGVYRAVVRSDAGRVSRTIVLSR